MSTWPAILIVALALCAVTYILGEWLSRELVSSRTPRPAEGEDARSDPLAEGGHRREDQVP